MQTLPNAIEVEILAKGQKVTRADRLRKHRIENVKIVAQVAMEPETLTPEEALDRMKQNAQYVIEHYHEEWKITHITAIRYVNNHPEVWEPKRRTKTTMP